MFDLVYKEKFYFYLVVHKFLLQCSTVFYCAALNLSLILLHFLLACFAMNAKGVPTNGAPFYALNDNSIPHCNMFVA